MPTSGEWKQTERGNWVWTGERPPSLDPTPLQRLAIRAIAVATIVVLPLGAIFVVNRNQTNQRIADSRAAVKREGEIRRAANGATRDLAIRFNLVQEWQQFDGCVADEKRDAVIVSILRTIPPSRRPAKIQEAIDALEPEHGDTVCVPPSDPRPPEARP